MKNTKNIVAASGLNIHNLSAEELGEAMDWRAEISPKFSLPMRETFCRAGLQSMVEEAMEEYKEKAEKFKGEGRVENYGFLPWNLAGAGAPWWSLPYGKNFAINGGVKDWIDEIHANNEYLQKYALKFETRCPDGPVEYAARFSGWLKVAGGMRGLVKAIYANLGNGMGSPYTTVNPFHLFDKWPSPHRAERQVWNVQRRANQILRPYGLSVSWQSLGQAVAYGPRAVGKAAVKAANQTVANFLEAYDKRASVGENNYYSLPEFQGKVDFLKLARGLAEMRNHPKPVQRWAVNRVLSGEFETLREAIQNLDRLVKDQTDGVRLWLDTQLIRTIHGVTVARGWGEDPRSFGDNGQMFLLRQQGTGRTYHYLWLDDGLREMVKIAIKEWRKRAQLERAEADLIGFLRGEWGFSPLIRRADSSQAGNCSPGTASWLRDQGWADLEFIPGQWLVSKLNHNLVRNVAMGVLKSMAHLKK